MNMSDRDLQLLLTGDFVSFNQMSFAQLNPGATYRHNWHIEVIAHYLELVRQGKIHRLIINLPPRSLKSILASVSFPAWLLGHNPSIQILTASYGQDLANKHAFDCRAVMNSGWYRGIFGTRLLEDRRSVSDFQTTNNGARLSTSVGGMLTGRGADIIIVDDPLKPDEALSETSRNNANAWIENTVFSRLNDKNTGSIVVIMQRLHADDLSGHLLEKGGWVHLCLPAIAEKDETFEINTPWGPRTYRRSPGDILHPERESLGTLAELRRNLGEYNFAGQYQQSPAPQGGGIVKLEWLHYYDPQHCPTRFDQKVLSIDTANKESELADYSVATLWGIFEGKYYLLDVCRAKLDYPKLKQKNIDLARQHKPDIILIENRASGTQLLQELGLAGIYQTHGVKPMTDKVMRMHAQTAFIENGVALFPRSAPCLEALVLELTTFPKGKHDDQVDSISQFLEWAKKPLPGWGFLMWMKQEVEGCK